MGFDSLVHRAIENVEESHRAAADFILTELQLGLQFADRSVNYAKAGEKAASQRNLCAANAAYKAIAKFLPRATFMPVQFLEVNKDLAWLGSIVNGKPQAKESLS